MKDGLEHPLLLGYGNLALVANNNILSLVQKLIELDDS